MTEICWLVYIFFTKKVLGFLWLSSLVSLSFASDCFTRWLAATLWSLSKFSWLRSARFASVNTASRLLCRLWLTLLDLYMSLCRSFFRAFSCYGKLHASTFKLIELNLQVLRLKLSTALPLAFNLVQELLKAGWELFVLNKLINLSIRRRMIKLLVPILSLVWPISISIDDIYNFLWCVKLFVMPIILYL